MPLSSDRPLISNFVGVSAKAVGFLGESYTAATFAVVNMALDPSKGPNVDIAMRIYEPTGKLLVSPQVLSNLPKDLPDEIDLSKKKNFAPMQFPIYLNRTGTFIIEVLAIDKLTKRNKSSCALSPHRPGHCRQHRSGKIMSQLQERIAQFRKMAADDPDNELGHFRLGQLLLEAEQYADAATSFRRTLELSPQFSKVFQLLGTCLIKLNQRPEAIKVLREGFAVADERGDNIPRDEIVKLLVQLGEPVPASKKAQGGSGGAGDGFHCQRPGCPAGPHAHQLPKPPMGDELGKKIFAQVYAECWDFWLRNLSIKVINEMRLDLSTEQGVEVYDQIMKETLGLT